MEPLRLLQAVGASHRNIQAGAAGELRAGQESRFEVECHANVVAALIDVKAKCHEERLANPY